MFTFAMPLSKTPMREIKQFRIRFEAPDTRPIEYDTQQLLGISLGDEVTDVFSPDTPKDGKFRVVSVTHDIRTREHNRSQSYTLIVKMSPMAP